MSVAPSLEEALAALEDEVHARLASELANDAGGTLQTELRYRGQDYRTWQRMGEAPAHVRALADGIAGSLPPAERSALVAQLTDMLARLHETALDEAGAAT
ncbi:MAG: hypothetical protein AAFX58_12440 [Pseudomonadota bacterium]